MVLRPLVQWLVRQPGPLGAYGCAYKEWRWGDPHVRLLHRLCDSGRASVDVGAHTGSYSFFLRRHSAHCIAFEPNPHLAAITRRRLPAVDVRNVALSDRPGTAVLRVPVNSLGRATIEANNVLNGATDVLDEITVQLTTLDQAITEPVGFIKIDVEGHELQVLQGAERILRDDRPNLILELEDRHNPGIIAATVAYLGQRGYRGWFRQPRGFLPISAFSRERDQANPEMPNYVCNFVFSTNGLRL